MSLSKFCPLPNLLGIKGKGIMNHKVSPLQHCYCSFYFFLSRFREEIKKRKDITPSIFSALYIVYSVLYCFSFLKVTNICYKIAQSNIIS